MAFADQLRAMNACDEAVAWVGSRTLRQAWTECERGDWMAWLTAKLHLDSRAAAADMAERVWHLVEPDSQLACAWAIDCARRNADDEERDAAVDAAGAAAVAAALAAARAAAGAAAWAAAGAAAGAAARAAAGDAALAAARAAAGAAAWADENKAQADTMREHFTWQQISAALAANGE
jgi:hypothetical protein